MTEILAYPLNTASFGKNYYDATDAQIYTMTRTNGVYSSSDFQVLASGGRAVTVLEGISWLNFAKFRGIAAANTVEKNGAVSFTIQPSITLPRIDRIVISYDLNDDKVSILLRQGTPASNPKSVSLRRDGAHFELGIADIFVSVGSGNITQSNISDLRLDEKLCGIMRDGVTGIPTDGLYKQFDDWFKQIKIELNEFEPANILNEITNIKNTAQMQKITNDDGSYKISITSGDFVTKMQELGTGMHTFYASYNDGATSRLPVNVNAAYRGHAFFTSESNGIANYGYVIAHNHKNEVFHGYLAGENNWLGWKNFAHVEQAPSVKEWEQVELDYKWTYVNSKFKDEIGVRYFKAPTGLVTLVVHAFAIEDGETWDIIAKLPQEARPTLPVNVINISDTTENVVSIWGGTGNIIVGKLFGGTKEKMTVIFETTYMASNYADLPKYSESLTAMQKSSKLLNTMQK